MRWRAKILAALLLILAVATIQRADEAADIKGAQDAFETLYGQDLKKAQATPDIKDDLALAGKMVDDAKVPPAADNAAVMTIICEKAYELSSRDPRGFAKAIEAMDLLAGGLRRDRGRGGWRPGLDVQGKTVLAVHR
jgi:hypothetical protein